MSYEPRTPIFSEADLVNQNSAYVTISTVSTSAGISFVPTRDLTIIGARFYWPGGAAVVMRIRLWNGAGAGSSIQFFDVATTSTAGIIAIIFTTPTKLICGHSYRLSVWQGSGTQAWAYMTTANLSLATGGFLVMSDITNSHQYPGWFRDSACYALGNAYPSTNDTANLYCITPTFLV